MSYWDEIVGQDEAVRTLAATADIAERGTIAHAWLITGPPGSGRSNIAKRFAAALIARNADERDTVFAQVSAHTHPDFTSLVSQKVIISIDEVRELAASAHFAPSLGRHRVILIEDADRMPERTSNVLLKSLEEPPESTVWILCAPSEADLIPTIRSRVRSLRLVTPQIEAVTQLLSEREQVPEEVAERAARLAQSHIGMARRLATDELALERRQRSLQLVLSCETVSDAMLAATELVAIATDDAQALSALLDEQERADTLRNLGVAPGQTIPPGLRGQIKALEEDQKRRATRNLRDGIDRILTDILSLYRDILLVQLDAEVALVNQEFSDAVRDRASRTQPEATLRVIDAIEATRERIARNVSPALALEAMMMSTLRLAQ